MTDPNHDMEKASLSIRVLGRILWNLYQGCLEAGFNQDQSFALTSEYIRGLAAIKSTPTGPESDSE